MVLVRKSGLRARYLAPVLFWEQSCPFAKRVVPLWALRADASQVWCAVQDDSLGEAEGADEGCAARALPVIARNSLAYRHAR